MLAFESNTNIIHDLFYYLNLITNVFFFFFCLYISTLKTYAQLRINGLTKKLVSALTATTIILFHHLCLHTIYVGMFLESIIFMKVLLTGLPLSQF